MLILPSASPDTSNFVCMYICQVCVYFQSGLSFVCMARNFLEAIASLRSLHSNLLKPMYYVTKLDQVFVQLGPRPKLGHTALTPPPSKFFGPKILSKIFSGPNKFLFPKSFWSKKTFWSKKFCPTKFLVQEKILVQ